MFLVHILGLVVVMELAENSLVTAQPLFAKERSIQLALVDYVLNL